MPGVPIVYRTPEEKAANPDRLNLDRSRLWHHLLPCCLLVTLNYRVKQLYRGDCTEQSPDAGRSDNSG